MIEDGGFSRSGVFLLAIDLSYFSQMYQNAMSIDYASQEKYNNYLQWYYSYFSCMGVASAVLGIGAIMMLTGIPLFVLKNDGILKKKVTLDIGFHNGLSVGFCFRL